LEVDLKFIITNEPTEEIFALSERQTEDVLLFGFDKTIATEDILRGLLRKSSAHIGIYYGNKDLNQMDGRILLPYSGSWHDKLAVKWTKRIVSIFPHQVIVLLINHPSEGLDFMESGNLKAFSNFYVVKREGDKMSAIVDELKNNSAITFLITGEVTDDESSGVQDSLEVLRTLAHVHCPFFLCSSKKERKHSPTSSDKSSLHDTELGSAVTGTTEGTFV